MAKNKFHEPKKGFNNLVSCECSNINDFNAGENKRSDLKRVGDNCKCTIGPHRHKTKTVKAYRVFVRENLNLP